MHYDTKNELVIIIIPGYPVHKSYDEGLRGCMIKDHTLYPYGIIKGDKDVADSETLGKIRDECLNEKTMHAR